MIVVGYDPLKGKMTTNCRTVSASFAYDCPMKGEEFIIEIHLTILIDHFHNNLLYPIQMRVYEVKVNYITKYLNDNPTDQMHSIVLHEKGETLLIPLNLHRATSYFTPSKPTMEEYNNCTRFSATSMEPEWDPYDPSF